MDASEHEAARKGRITGSVIRTICLGTGTAKNKLVEALRSPRPFRRGTSENMPAALRHGILMEPQARADFWERHPQYDMYPDADFIMPGHPLWNPVPGLKREHWDFVGVSPDGIVSVDIRGALSPIAVQEVKCPFKREELYRSVDGGWKDKWIHQIDWALILTGLPRAVLVISAPYEQPISAYRYTEFWVQADEERHAKILQKVDEFIHRWQAGIPFDDRGRYARTMARLLQRSKK